MHPGQRFHDFAVREARGQSDRYERWALAVAADDRLTALIGALPPDKQQPNLVLAAARFHGIETDSAEEFRRQLLRRWDEVTGTIRRRGTQTNEAGRAATLLPALADLAGPVALIEVGASAGLCLYPDRFSYDYGDRLLHPVDGPSPVRLPCRVTGGPPIPERLPEIVFRAGIDVNPLDAADPDDRHWLETLVWPGDPRRLERLRAACAIAAADPPLLVRGDLLDRLGDLVHSAPSGSTVVVFHSAVLTYLTPAGRTRFRDLVTALPVHWISQEGPGVFPDLAAGLPGSDSGTARFALARDGVPLGWAAPHGGYLDWAAPRAAA
ncbi:DUF2332 domain-containing protein [Nocardia thailandica]|uniref:DUF2332 domain-containing protein n=1 Tax=Nocardia thailandica TaxID=257275 RepID=UPI000317124E|nr:DUF2332 domain-containing protein [Nocardia thailandica]